MDPGPDGVFAATRNKNKKKPTKSQSSIRTAGEFVGSFAT
jgi:hypothetical protein